MNIIFMGRKKHAADMLKWTVSQGIVVKFVCTDSDEHISPVDKLAKSLGILVGSMEEAERYIERHSGDIDLVVSYLYNRKIREPLLKIPKYGCINFHPAILPDWRGCGGYNIAILKHLLEWGASAHYVDENIDTGNIIRVYKFNFDYRLETAYSLEKKTQSIQKDLYKSVISDVVSYGRLPSVKQKRNTGRYISKKDMIDMMRVDISNISKEDLDDMIRAFWYPPYNGAGFEIDGDFYTLVNRQILEML